jgi:RNA polymerase sigma-70 factor (ECF subfamily)
MEHERQDGESLPNAEGSRSAEEETPETVELEELSELLDEAEDPALLAQRAEDHALIRRAQTGDEDAFRDLVKRHEQRAWRVARNLVASDDDAQELAQEAFLRVFKNIARFDFDHAFTTWLYRIVTNLAIDHLRRRRPAQSTARADEDEGEFDLPDQRADGPSQRLEREDLAREVRECLAALAPHFQSVLVLREMEGLPCKEIAAIVGATHVTVRWRLHRGRKLFQDEWERRARFKAAGGDADWSGASSGPTANDDDDAPVDDRDEDEKEAWE